MNKYLICCYHYYDSTCVVEAESLTQAFVKITEYYGIPYPMTTEDLEKLFVDFNVNKFIDFLETFDSLEVTRFYEIKNTLYEKNMEEIK